jgi:predicted PhzF superfamily epimerase YddE/YHI9
MGVGVLDAEHLPAAVMRDLTREVRQFETAFLAAADLPARSARLRIFTEDEELDFAGHPVLGAAAVLHTLLPAPDAEESWALDVATGSAAGPAAGYLLHHGVRPAGDPCCWVPAAPRRPPRRGPLLVHQGRFTGRPSTIEVHPGRDGRLWVGEPVAPVAAGRFHAHLT